VVAQILFVQVEHVLHIIPVIIGDEELVLEGQQSFKGGWLLWLGKVQCCGGIRG